MSVALLAGAEFVERPRLGVAELNGSSSTAHLAQGAAARERFLCDALHKLP